MQQGRLPPPYGRADDQSSITYKHKLINCGPCVCLTVIAVVAVSVVAIILSVVASGAGSAHFGTHVYKISGDVLNAPFGQSLNGNGGVLAMTMPDTTDFYHRTFAMTDISGGAHTFTLPGGVTFDGGFTVATFNGVAGSTLVYRRVSATRVVVVSSDGVAFS